MSKLSRKNRLSKDGRAAFCDIDGIIMLSSWFGTNNAMATQLCLFRFSGIFNRQFDRLHVYILTLYHLNRTQQAYLQDKHL